LKLNKVARRMLENRRTAFVFGDEIVEAVASRCTEVDSGARNIDNILTNTLMPEMSKELLGRMAVGEQINEIKVGLDGDGFTFAVS
jgi:type VI secretion system protein VasG